MAVMRLEFLCKALAQGLHVISGTKFGLKKMKSLGYHVILRLLVLTQYYTTKGQVDMPLTAMLCICIADARQK